MDIHNCGRAYRFKMMIIKWLSKRIQNCLKYNLKMKIKEVKEKSQRKWNIGINDVKVISSKCTSRDMVNGPFLE